MPPPRRPGRPASPRRRVQSTAAAAAAKRAAAASRRARRMPAHDEPTRNRPGPELVAAPPQPDSAGPPAAPGSALPATAEPATAGPDTAGPATAALDTARPDTAAPDTAVPDTAVPATAGPGAAGPATAAPGTATAGSASRHRRVPLLPVVLGVATVLLGGLAAWSGVQAGNLRTGSAGNTALTDTATTTQISGEATTAVQALFSYDYADPARTRLAAQRTLTGSAVRQYAPLFRAMQADSARFRRLVLATTVTNTGVEMLAGPRARVLVFGSQTLSSAGQAPQRFGVMVALDLMHQKGRWEISGIDTFGGAD